MTGSVLLILALLSFLVFIIPQNYKYALSLALLSALIGISSFLSLSVLFNMQTLIVNIDLLSFQNYPEIKIDSLSAFFVLVVNFTVLVGFLYARSYLAKYHLKKSVLQFSIHYFSYIWLYLAMFLVCTISDGFSFLIVWELMSLSSFLLVIFDAEDRDTMKSGINYLIQMHVGFLFLMFAFIILGNATGNANLDQLSLYFQHHDNVLLFSFFFIGFGIKAGFMPLHSWLPQAHPAAPSHISGVMSGVMIKMGIFGIARVMFALHDHLLEIGTFVLIISAISGLLGVMFAIVQHDLKRLLAYHSIENIGIIGMGLGIGLIGKALNMPVVEILGFGGGLLHVLNHSLFKSLLFFNAGTVYMETHTRNIERLGGLIKKMPTTAILFLIGSLAICGLPPFNGFVSEYLIYSGLFNLLNLLNFKISALMIGGIISLALIGGLAIFCFTKAFSVVFLGNSRSEATQNAKEVDKPTLIFLSIIALVMLLIGVFPIVFVKPIFAIVSQFTGQVLPYEFTVSNFSNLMNISIIGGLFVVLVSLLLLYRSFHLKRINLENSGPTWGCAYTAGTSKHQYTATSFADNFSSIASPILNSKKEMISIQSSEIFPVKRHFVTKQVDVIKKKAIDLPIEKILTLLKKIAVMQTGEIQHYIIYAFVFMILIFVLTFFNVI